MNAHRGHAELYAEMIEQLGRPIPIAAITQLRAETLSLLADLPEVRGSAEVEGALPRARSVLERALAVALPLLDYGGERGAREVTRMLQILATELGEREGQGGELMLALVLHDLTWTFFADCLARSRPETLSRIGAVAIPRRYRQETLTVLRADDLRHAIAFERGADTTYLSWRDWYLGSELLASLSYVRDRAQLEPFLAEAELIAALAFAQRNDDRSFCAVVSTDSGAERRLRVHLREPESTSALASLLRIPVADLPQELNRLYSLLVGPSRFGGEGPLIPTQ